MKRLVSGGTVILLIAAASTQTPAQTTQTKTIANAIDVYVFPTKGQSQSRQNNDEAQCYGWAVENTGVDPFEAAKASQRAAAQQQEAAQATQGSGVRGAAKGAAGGALIGAIAGNAGMGAAIGAAAGAIFGRGKAEYQAGQYQEQTAKMQQITAEQMARFKKAFSTCLEGKNYIVKY